MDLRTWAEQGRKRKEEEGRKRKEGKKGRREERDMINEEGGRRKRGGDKGRAGIYKGDVDTSVPIHVQWSTFHS